MLTVESFSHRSTLLRNSSTVNLSFSISSTLCKGWSAGSCKANSFNLLMSTVLMRGLLGTVFKRWKR